MLEPSNPPRSFRELPGVVRGVVAAGKPVSDALLDELRGALCEEWWRFESRGELLDQRGWSLRDDAALAHRACKLAVVGDAALRARLESVEAWLDERGPAPPPDDPRPDWLACTTWARELDDAAAAALYASVHPGATEAERAAFQALRTAPLLEAAVVATIVTARLASEGWLAYYAHRALPAPATVVATNVVVLLADAFAVDLDEVIRASIELARARSLRR